MNVIAPAAGASLREMKLIDRILTISGPISGTSAMMPSSQANALVIRPTTTTLPAMTPVLTFWSTASQVRPIMATQSSTITRQFFHQYFVSGFASCSVSYVISPAAPARSRRYCAYRKAAWCAPVRR